MNYFKQTLRELQVGVVVCGILNILIGMWFPKDMLGYVLGGLLGTVTALVMTDNMARAIVKAVGNPEKANAKVRNAHLLRYLVAIIVMAVAVFSPRVNWVAALISIFSIKFASFMTPLIHIINLKINPNALESDGSEETEEEIIHEDAE